jgi:excisionase family DNA binding protein
MAAYTIARDYGDALERQARLLLASKQTAEQGRQLLAFVNQARESGRQLVERLAGPGSVGGTSEVPLRPADAQSSVSAPPRTVGVAEVAERLQLSESYIRRLCRDEGLSDTKVGRTWLIDEKSVDDLVLARREKGCGP